MIITELIKLIEGINIKKTSTNKILIKVANVDEKFLILMNNKNLFHILNCSGKYTYTYSNITTQFIYRIMQYGQKQKLSLC